MVPLLRRFRVGTRFAAASVLVVVFMILSGVVALAGSDAQSAAQDDVASATRLVDYANRQSYWDAAVTNAQTAYAWDVRRLSAEELRSESSARNTFLRAQAGVLESIRQAPLRDMTPRERWLNTLIEQYWDEFFQADLRVAQAYQVGDLDGGDAIVNGEGFRAYANILTRTEQLQTSARARAQRTTEHVREVASRVRLGVLFALSLALVVVVAIMVMIDRTVIAPLRRLTEQAERLATTDLARATAAARAAGDGDVGPELPRFPDAGMDEIAGLAASLNHLQSSALDSAKLQSRGDRAAKQMVVNLGRRSQNLLTRLLGYLSELEKSERDPAVLEKLFRMDHLSTRVRRNAESMLVMAGAEQTRTKFRPTPVTTVVRAALAEIEAYSRVSLVDVVDVVVHGSATADLSHLLAELLENATMFSPPTSRVSVDGRMKVDGSYQLTITDFGVGMTDDELERANAIIASADLDRLDSKVLGHRVIGILAARWSIHVGLRRGVSGGLIARIDLPGTLVSPPAEPLAGAAVARVP